MVEDAEMKVIEEENIDDDELDEGFLFGVENKVVKRLRKDYIAKDAENKKLKAKTEQLDAALQETKTALHEKDVALHEKDVALQEKDAEIERLKADKGAVSKKPGKSLKDSP
jgi:septal ring factor EnvC (AmiA/AmiB activator)